MSERAWNLFQGSLVILMVLLAVLTFASHFGWIATGYRGALNTLFLLTLFAILGARYFKEKDHRSSYLTYALSAVVISIPMITLAFLRDYWLNAWFQSTLFPLVFVPVMFATLLGYGLLGIFLFRSTRRAG